MVGRLLTSLQEAKEAARVVQQTPVTNGMEGGRTTAEADSSEQPTGRRRRGGSGTTLAVSMHQEEEEEGDLDPDPDEGWESNKATLPPPPYKSTVRHTSPRSSSGSSGAGRATFRTMTRQFKAQFREWMETTRAVSHESAGTYAQSKSRKTKIQEAFRYFKSHPKMPPKETQAKLAELLGKEFARKAWEEARVTVQQQQQKQQPLELLSPRASPPPPAHRHPQPPMQRKVVLAPYVPAFEFFLNHAETVIAPGLEHTHNEEHATVLQALNLEKGCINLLMSAGHLPVNDAMLRELVKAVEWVATWNTEYAEYQRLLPVPSQNMPPFVPPPSFLSPAAARPVSRTTQSATSPALKSPGGSGGGGKRPAHPAPQPSAGGGGADERPKVRSFADCLYLTMVGMDGAREAQIQAAFQVLQTHPEYTQTEVQGKLTELLGKDFVDQAWWSSLIPHTALFQFFLQHADDFLVKRGRTDGTASSAQAAIQHFKRVVTSFLAHVGDPQAPNRLPPPHPQLMEEATKTVVWARDWYKKVSTIQRREVQEILASSQLQQELLLVPPQEHPPRHQQRSTSRLEPQPQQQQQQSPTPVPVPVPVQQQPPMDMAPPLPSLTAAAAAQQRPLPVPVHVRVQQPAVMASPLPPTAAAAQQQQPQQLAPAPAPVRQFLDMPPPSPAPTAPAPEPSQAQQPIVMASPLPPTAATAPQQQQPQQLAPSPAPLRQALDMPPPSPAPTAPVPEQQPPPPPRAPPLQAPPAVNAGTQQGATQHSGQERSRHDQGQEGAKAVAGDS